MKRNSAKPMDSSEREALDLIEEAVRMLRTRPAILLPYYVGSIPFVAGFLFFWSDMVGGAQAHSRLPAASMLMALLFGWMKAWQSVFMLRCRAELGFEVENRPSLRAWLRTASLQFPIQATGLFVLPLCATVMLPFGWAYAFYQNYSLIGTASAAGMRKAIRDSVGQSKLWPAQNHRFLALMMIFGLVVFFNLSFLLGFLPALLKILIGTDTEFTRSMYSTSNTTFSMTIAGLAYLAVDPLLKTFYVIRCFLGASRATGEDILAGLRTLPSVAKASLASLLLIVALALPVNHAWSAEDSVPASNARFESKAFNETADSVLEQREYSWRLPREEVKHEKSWVEEMVTDFFSSTWNSIAEGVKAFFRWLEEFFERRSNTAASGGPSTITQTMRVLAYGFIVAILLIGLIFFVRMWRRRPLRAVMAAAPIQPLPLDLTADHVDASQLEVSEWLTMAQNLIREGNLRLGLRAMYLATLSGLAEREWIRTARHKTNMEYQAELERRAHHTPELPQLFAGHVLDFERVWYGNHEIAESGIEAFRRDYERILSLATR